MAARTGMANLITRWREMVEDTGSAVWTDDQAQRMLDAHRRELFEIPLRPVGRFQNGATVYKLFLMGFGNLEEATSGEDAWRLYDTNGVTVEAEHTIDYQLGHVFFDDDQIGQAFYVDARTYDLNGAAADAWRERMGKTAGWFNFSADGASYSRAQWFEHCREMADKYAAQAWVTVADWGRGDVNP